MNRDRIHAAMLAIQEADAALLGMTTWNQSNRTSEAMQAIVSGQGAPGPQGMRLQPPMEVLNAVGQIVKLTPKVDTDGREIRAIRGEVLTRVQTILTEHPSATPEILVMAWENYLKTRPTKLKAPQYFFGRQEDQVSTAANWRPFARLVWSARKPAPAPATGPVLLEPTA